MFGECHGHIFMNGKNYLQAKHQYEQGIDQDDIRGKLSLYRQEGITFFRDGGDHYGASLFARKIAPEYGIDYRTPAFAIHRKGQYGGIVGRGFETIREYRMLISRVKEQKGDFIKVMFSGIMDFDTDGRITGDPLSPSLIREMVHIAHEEGFAVMAHVNGAEAILCAVEAGTDSIEHGNFMDGDCLEALAESDCIWVPTISAIHNLLGSDRFSHDLIRHLDQEQAAKIRKAWNLGCRIALGSDAGAFTVLHARGIRTEYDRIKEIVGSGEDTDIRLMAAEKQIRERFRRC